MSLGITTDAGFVSRAFDTLHTLLHMHAIYVLQEQKTIIVAEDTIELPHSCRRNYWSSFSLYSSSNRRRLIG
jgi:hypothetical protein